MNAGWGELAVSIALQSKALSFHSLEGLCCR